MIRICRVDIAVENCPFRHICSHCGIEWAYGDQDITYSYYDLFYVNTPMIFCPICCHYNPVSLKQTSPQREPIKVEELRYSPVDGIINAWNSLRTFLKKLFGG